MKICVAFVLNALAFAVVASAQTDRVKYGSCYPVRGCQGTPHDITADATKLENVDVVDCASFIAFGTRYVCTGGCLDNCVGVNQGICNDGPFKCIKNF